MRELDSAKLLSASLKLSESQSTELVNKLRRELEAKIDSINLVEGVDGPQGPTGRQGDRGERGFIGGTGARGERGIPGLTGEEGATGERGIQGLTGEQGIQGLTGEQGIQGLTGEQGIQGATGERGEPGEKGDQGIQGAEGPMGLRGEHGLTGDAGINGKNGIDGKAGINGKNGIDGKAGINGKNGIDGKVGPRGDKGDPGSDANVAPLEKKFDQLTKTVDTKLSKIAYNAAMGTSAGSGEVNLRNLDDVDYNSVSSPTDGHSLVYNGTLGKWQANSGSGGISTATFNSALANTNSFIAANALTERQHLANTNSFIKAQLANTNTFIASQVSRVILVNTNLTGTNTAIRTLVSDRLQVANAAAIYQTKAVERQHLANTNSFIKAQLANTNTFIATKTSTSTFNSALANTNLAITNVKTGLTTTNTALRLLINDRLQVANAVTLYATKAGPTTSGLLAHTGRATISTNLTVSGNTTSNKTTVTSSLISSGNTVLNGGLSANGSFGTANYVLKTNGAGVFWATAASGGSDTSTLAVANSFVKLTSYSSNTHGITQLANNVISTTALTTNPAGHITLLLPNNTTIKIAYWL